jgi:hypothetical protein
VGTASVAVTVSGLVASGGTAAAAGVGLSVTSRLLLRSITLSGAVDGTVDSLGGGRSGSAGVELWVVT